MLGKLDTPPDGIDALRPGRHNVVELRQGRHLNREGRPGPHGVVIEADPSNQRRTLAETGGIDPILEPRILEREYETVAAIVGSWGTTSPHCRDMRLVFINAAPDIVSRQGCISRASQSERKDQGVFVRQQEATRRIGLPGDQTRTF